MRKARIKRKTTEVEITVALNIDGDGDGQVETDIKFLNHLLVTLAKHSLFDIAIKAIGDLKHHISEDVALTLGEALKKALGDKRGIRRFGAAYVTMDDSLARAAIDLGGRAYSRLDLQIRHPQIEDFETEDIEHFFQSFAQAAKINLHVTVLYGTNDHHKIEAAVKALALALRDATHFNSRLSARGIPSAKGVL